ncbi:MAG: hypothetical protein E7G37_07790, partial [Streptococcus sp.]|nr:hypothetical protein [Streptococcus sp.]
MGTNNNSEDDCFNYRKKRIQICIIKILLSIIICTFSSGFTYSNNVQKVPDYIEEDILKGNIKLEDKTNVNLK